MSTLACAKWFTGVGSAIVIAGTAQAGAPARTGLEPPASTARLATKAQQQAWETAHPEVFVADGEAPADAGARGTCDLTEVSPNLAIPDATNTVPPIPGVRTHTLSTTGNGLISDLNVNLRINHSWQGDLIVKISNSFREVTVVNRPGVPQSNFGFSADHFGLAAANFVLDDEAALVYDTGSMGVPAVGIANVTGPWKPDGGLLSAFDGDPAADTWTITISDNAFGDTGTLVRWGVCMNRSLSTCLWDNGEFNPAAGDANAQISEHYPEDPVPDERVTADDFYLCPGYVYRISQLQGTLVTNNDLAALSPDLPIAYFVIYEDCNGLPADEIATCEDPLETGFCFPIFLSDAVDTGDNFPVPGIPPVGNVIDVVIYPQELWLYGGKTYWISLVGAGFQTPVQNYHWGWGMASGTGATIKGVPGVGRVGSDGAWDELCEHCIGCRDFDFQIYGEFCKVILDQSEFDSTVVGAPSLQNGALTSDRSRSAADAVIAPCNGDQALCFVEAYIWTNCEPFEGEPPARLDIYTNDCNSPNELILTVPHDDLVEVDVPPIVVPVPPFGTTEVRLYCYRFFNFPADFVLEEGKNYWFSAYAVGGGNGSQRGFFAFHDPCEGCPIGFNQGMIKGEAVGFTAWRPVDDLPGIGPEDFAILIARETEQPPEMETPGIGGGGLCLVDLDQSGTVDVPDIFVFLSDWFAGCP